MSGNVVFPLTVRVEGEPRRFLFTSRLRRRTFAQGFREAMRLLGNEKAVRITRAGPVPEEIE